MSGFRAGNLLAGAPGLSNEEQFDTLLSRPGLRIERIVSTGQASPPGFWYDQPQDEWVCVISRAASVQIDGEGAPRRLTAGDWLEIPAHVRHRVVWTEAAQPTIWLTVHIDAP